MYSYITRWTVNIGNGITSQVSNMASQQKVGDAVGTQVLRKAMDIQQTQATQLIEAIPDAPKPKPAGDSMLGSNFDAHA